MSTRYFPKINISNIYNALKSSLKLQWLGGQNSKNTILQTSSNEQISIVGYLNFVHHYPISVIGNKEYQYLANLSSKDYKETIKKIFNQKLYIIIIADAQNAPDEFIELANENKIALLKSESSSQLVIENLIHYLNTNVSESTIMHGVFLEIFDFGVLIFGDSGCGKSELALELIHRGHRLVADDAPKLMRITPSTVIGVSTELLQEFIEIRGLGILNIKKMFGETAIKDRKRLQLIINLIQSDNQQTSDIIRLNTDSKVRNILDINIPEISIPITIGSNMATLVESGVRNQILINNGYNAADNFIELQRNAIKTNHSKNKTEIIDSE